MIGIGVSFVIFVAIRAFAGPGPSTMNKEWEEATNEYLKVCHTAKTSIQQHTAQSSNPYEFMATVLT